MQNDLKEYFRAYRLPKDIEKHAVVDKRKKDTKNYQLELVMEAETVDEILNKILPIQFFYEVGYEHVQKFEVEDGYAFKHLSAYGDRNYYGYHTDGYAVIDGAHAFQYIYENYLGEIILVITAWDAQRIEKIDVSFDKVVERKYYHRWYALELEQKIEKLKIMPIGKEECVWGKF